MKKIYYVGLDPSARESGFAVCIICGNKVSFIVFKEYTDFIRWAYFKAPKVVIAADIAAMSEVDRIGVKEVEVFFCVENSNLTNATFLDSKIKSVANKISRDAGKNQWASQLAVNILREEYGENIVFEVSPLEKGRKWTQNEFDMYLKANQHHLAEPTRRDLSQDKRDAYCLALNAEKHSKMKVLILKSKLNTKK